jgi:excinuclease UvrABC nuclease subunit
MCAGLVNKDDYKKNIKHIKDMFEGKMSVIKKRLGQRDESSCKVRAF